MPYPLHSHDMNLSINLFGGDLSENPKILQGPIQQENETPVPPYIFTYVPLNDQLPALIFLIEKNGGQISLRPVNQSIKELHLLEKYPAHIPVSSPRKVSPASRITFFLRLVILMFKEFHLILCILSFGKGNVWTCVTFLYPHFYRYDIHHNHWPPSKISCPTRRIILRKENQKQKRKNRESQLLRIDLETAQEN